MSEATDAPSRVLVVIPTYNEIENLERIIGRLHASVPAHVLVADDASPDGTGELADEMADPTPVCTCCTGREVRARAAYLAGFRWGRERGYDVLVEMDADGSHPPRSCPAC